MLVSLLLVVITNREEDFRDNDNRLYLVKLVVVFVDDCVLDLVRQLEHDFRLF